MYFRQLLLLAASVLGLLILYKTEFITTWLDTHIVNPSTTEQFDHTSIEERREMRYATTWSICKYMEKTLADAKVDPSQVIVLQAPNDYFKAQHSQIHLAEPAEFYYHCGIHTIWTTAPNVNKATWVLMPDPKVGLIFAPVDQQHLQALLDTFKNYKPAL